MIAFTVVAIIADIVLLIFPIVGLTVISIEKKHGHASGYNMLEDIFIGLISVLSVILIMLILFLINNFPV
jgi:hypothetical protein